MFRASEAHAHAALGPRSLRLLAVAALFGWLMGIVAIGQRAFHSEMQALSDKASRDLDVQRLSLLGVAQRYKHIPYTSAKGDAVQAALKVPPDPASIQRSDSYLADINRRVGADALYLMNRQGLCLSASNWNEPGSFKGETYDFRPYFKDALAGRLGQYYAVGTTTGKPGMYFASPVQAGNDVVGVMAVKLVLSDIEKNWSESLTPIILMDKLGIVFLTSVPQYLYTTTRPISEPDLQEIVETRQYGAKRRFDPTPWEMAPSFDKYGRMVRATLAGKEHDLLAKGEYLPEYDWTLLVSVDTAEASKARWIAVTIAASASLILLMGALFWLQRERRMLELRRARVDLENRVGERTRELLERNVFLKAMEDSSPVGIRAMDQNGKVTSLNARLCEITGYSREDMLGRLPPYPYWHPEETDEHWRNIESTLQGKAVLIGYEQRFRHREGRDILVMIYTAPLLLPGGELYGYISSMVDITDKRKAEAQHQQNVEQMRRAQYLSALGEMASTLAHEISQPLQAIAFDSAVATRSLERGNETVLQETLRAIGMQARRATDIVQRVKNPLKSSDPKLCQINDLVRAVVGLLRIELEQKRTRMLMRLDDKVPGLVMDRVKIEQVVQNLLMNAMQAMQDKPHAERLVTIETGLENEHLFVRVMDQGPGVPDDKAKDIFKPFFTTKKDGIGLGLNICRSIVEDHGGRLVFHNRAGGGACFTILFNLTA